MFHVPAGLVILSILREDESNDEHKLWTPKSDHGVYESWPRNLNQPYLEEVRFSLDKLTEQGLVSKGKYDLYTITEAGVQKLIDTVKLVETTLAPFHFDPYQ